MSRFLPYGRHSIDDDDIAEVTAVLRGDWLTTGPAVERFERAFAEVVGASHAVSCNSGTAALHLAALAAGLGEGDQAIVPTITFLATANAVRFCGADVVFADCDPTTGLMGLEHVEAALQRADRQRVKAVFPVHLAGQATDLPGISRWAAERGLVVIDDACHAIGTEYVADGTVVKIGQGIHSAMSAFSLHPVKTVTMAEGGVVTTASAELAQRMKMFRSHGMTRVAADFQNRDLACDRSGQVNPWYYEMVTPSPNYRASDIACALGTSQLRKLEHFVSRRLELVAAYDEGLARLFPLVRPVAKRNNHRVSWHLYPVLIDFAGIGLERGEVMRRLARQNIGSQVHYIPVHWQPYYRQRYGALDLPGAAQYYAQTLSLPLFPDMTRQDVTRVIVALADSLHDAATAGQ